MTRRINIKERGLTPRRLRSEMTKAHRASYEVTGEYFDENLRDLRFTHAHATEAGYLPRNKRYELRKFRLFKHTYPLEYSGESRKNAKVSSTVVSSTGIRLKYSGLNKLNYKNPKSKIHMAEEFRRITDRESNILADVYDKDLDQRVKQLDRG